MKSNSIIWELNTVPNLESDVGAFFSWIDRFFTDCTDIMFGFYPDCKKSRKPFEKIKECANKEFYEWIEHNCDWMRMVRTVRNKLDFNHADENDRVIINNFRSAPGNKFYLPSIDYVSSDSAQKGALFERETDLVFALESILHDSALILPEMLRMVLIDKHQKKTGSNSIPQSLEEILAGFMRNNKNL